LITTPTEDNKIALKTVKTETHRQRWNNTLLTTISTGCNNINHVVKKKEFNWYLGLPVCV
jgi:hypothetical protein